MQGAHSATSCAGFVMDMLLVTMVSGWSPRSTCVSRKVDGEREDRPKAKSKVIGHDRRRLKSRPPPRLPPPSHFSGSRSHVCRTCMSLAVAAVLVGLNGAYLTDLIGSRVRT